MPNELKEDLGDELRERCAEIEMPDLYDQIATEEEAEDSAALLEYLTKVGHPALTMDPLF
jgi:acetyl-CoA synthase